jgi:hypothetical protein
LEQLISWAAGDPYQAISETAFAVQSDTVPTPEASPVSSTQHIHLGLNNPSLHFSKYGLAFF